MGGLLQGGVFLTYWAIMTDSRLRLRFNSAEDATLRWVSLFFLADCLLHSLLTYKVLTFPPSLGDLVYRV